MPKIVKPIQPAKPPHKLPLDKQKPLKSGEGAQSVKATDSGKAEPSPDAEGTAEPMKRIAVFVSGGGTNFQALLDAKERGELPNGEFVLVIASNSKAYALERAERYGIPSLVVSRKECREAHPGNETAGAAEFDQRLTNALETHQVDLIVLAGYLSILSENVTKRFENRIINIHPALIPSFCGPGFYGLHVHEAALARGVKITGATVHFVNAVCDGGPIIFQKPVIVEDGDTPETLQRRVMEQAEWELLPKAVALYCDGKIIVRDNRAFVQE